VLPVAHGAAIGCNGVPLEAGTTAVAWIVCGHDPPVSRRIPARLVDHVDVMVPLREEGTGAGRERLLRRGWVLPSVGVGHVALGLLVPLPGSPRVGVPREEDRVKVVFAGNSCVPNLFKKRPHVGGADTDHLTAIRSVN